MANGGYGAGLFDSKGPKDFAEAIGEISKELTGVTTAFSKFSDDASGNLGTISKAADSLIDKLKQVQSTMAAASTGGGGGAPGPQSTQNIPQADNTGISQPPQWSQGNAPQPSPGPMVNNASDMAGTQGGTASQGGWWSGMWRRLSGGSAAGVNAAYGGTQPGAGTGMTQGTAQGGGMGANTMGQRAVESMIPAGIGAATGYAQGLSASAIQGQAIGAMYAPAFGVGQRSLYTIPNGIWAQNPQDYAQANAAGIQLGLAPGSQNWSRIMGPNGGLNQIMAMSPGLTRQQAIGQYGAMIQPGTLNSAMAFGFNFTPGGKMESPQQMYEQVFARLSQGTGGKPTGRQIEDWMRPGGPWQANLQSLGWDQQTIQNFQNFALSKAGVEKSGKTLGNVGNASAGGAGIGTSSWYQQLKRQSSQSQVESQAEPALAQAAKDLNQAANALLNLAKGPASFLGGGQGGIGKMFGGISSLLGGVPGLGGIPGVGGGLPGLGGGGGGGGILGLLGGGGGLPGLPMLGLGKGLLGHIPGVGGAIGSVTSHIGGFLGGLFGGSAAGAAEPKKATESKSATAAKNDSVHSLLTNKPPTNSLLACLTQPIPKGGSVASVLFGLGNGAGGTAFPGGTGTTGSQGGGAGGGSAWHYRNSMIGPVDLSGMFSGPGSTKTGSSSSNTSQSSTSGSSSTAYTGPSTGTLTDAQVQQLWKSVGGPANVAAAMSGIAQAESGREPGNVQKGQPPGLTGWGLWQITPTSGISQNGKYGNLLDPTNNAKAALALYQQAGNTLQPWSGDPYVQSHGGGKSSGASYARGTQYVARNQLALLHRGEAVIPAADNYSSGSYNKGGSAGAGGGGDVHLNFKPGSVVLQVPASATQQDMETLANQFVNAIAAPGVITAARST